MSQDRARNEISAQFAWNMVDYLPSWGGADLLKRGGWEYYSGALTSATANSYIQQTQFVPYSAGPHQVSFDNVGTCFFDAVSKGHLFTPFQTAYQKELFFCLDSARATSARTINAVGTVAAVAAAPRARYACTWGERIIVGAVSAATSTTGRGERTIFFSAADDPTTWDQTNAWFNMTHAIKGLAVANGTIIAFSDEGVERLVGTNPPPGGNLARRWLANHGCIDWRSICNWGQYVVWSDIDGIYMTDGASITDITQQAGLKQYYISTLTNFSASYTVAGGVYQDKYIVSVMNGTTFVDAFVFDLLTRSGYRLSNLKVCGFSTGLAGAAGAGDEIYMASRVTNRILAASTMWEPSAAVSADGDGTAVLPVVELPFITMFYRIAGMRRIFNTTLGMQERVRNVYLGYDIRDPGSSNPALTVSYVSDPAGTAYTALSPTFLETPGYIRKKLPVRHLGRGHGFKIAQTGASSTTKIYSFGFEGHTQEAR